ncbi:MAG: type II toxin-antitoxin system VapC family toxin [Micrococcales bacterium]|nr:type II toxin-antitoxin system VapC family toxin [Micrococcales bacterium]
MTGYLLDTCTLVDLLRAKDRLAAERFAAAQGQVFASTVSVMELVCGAERSADPVGNRAQIEALLTLVRTVDFDMAAAEQAAVVRASLLSAGTPIGPYDVQIAGHALALGMTVITANTDEFSRVPGLTVESWRAHQR